MTFLCHVPLPGRGLLLAAQPRRRQRFLVASAIRAKARTKAVDDDVLSNSQRTAGLLAPPKRPVQIWRVPPSERTVLSRERANQQRAEEKERERQRLEAAGANLEASRERGGGAQTAEQPLRYRRDRRRSEDERRLRGGDERSRRIGDEGRPRSEDEDRRRGRGERRSRGGDEDRPRSEDEDRRRGRDERRSRGGDEDRRRGGDEDRRRGGDEGRRPRSGDEGRRRDGDERRPRSGDERRPRGGDEGRPRSGDEDRRRGADERRSRSEDEDRRRGGDERRPRSEGLRLRPPPAWPPDRDRKDAPPSATAPTPRYGFSRMRSLKGNPMDVRSRTPTVSPAARRRARYLRKKARMEGEVEEIWEREEIFEVGPEGMELEKLASILAVEGKEIVKMLFMNGIEASFSSMLDKATVKAIAAALHVEVLDREVDVSQAAKRKLGHFIEESDLDHLQPRPPVVVVMGHVDHGKTSLLDFIRKTRVASREAGGITQAIGAYTCTVPWEGKDKKVTFLDTPGHEAFSSMRARGARVTDIAIIVIAADDGVQPQTVEAIRHANAALVPIVVAINKIDTEGANPERVKQDLTEYNLVPEEWGGKTPMVLISARKGTGVETLLETVLLVAELEDLQANPDRSAKGTVLESSMNKLRGPMATMLVQAGTLRVGDSIVAGSAVGKVRIMRTAGGIVKKAGPSIAVQMTGLSSVPKAGDEFVVYPSETEARTAAEAAEEALRTAHLSEIGTTRNVITLASTSRPSEMGKEAEGIQQLNIILKTDVSGSCEAVKAALRTLPQGSIRLRFLLASPGEICLADLDLAVASKALVLGFNIKATDVILADAKQRHVNMKTYAVIYDLVDDVKAAMEGRLKAVKERFHLGTAEVKAVFGDGHRRVAGCIVADGLLRRGCNIEVTRGRQVVYVGKLTSLRRAKDNVKEVQAGVECGVACEEFKDWQEGDKIVAFELVERKLKLEEAHAPTVELSYEEPKEVPSRTPTFGKNFKAKSKVPKKNRRR